MKLIIALLLLISSTANAGLSFQRVKALWTHLENTAGYHINLCYDSDPYSNAYIYAHGVCITQGMLDDLQNDDQAMMVLGHELAHYVKEHYRKQQSTSNELEADKIGYYYCKKSGYKKCKGFFKRMKHLYGNESDDVHPTWDYREKQL